MKFSLHVVYKYSGVCEFGMYMHVCIIPTCNHGESTDSEKHFDKELCEQSSTSKSIGWGKNIYLYHSSVILTKRVHMSMLQRHHVPKKRK